MSKRKQRNRQGQFQSPRTLANLYLLLGFMLMGMYLEWYYRPVELLNPLVSVNTVEAREMEPRQSPSPSPFQPVEATTEPHSEKKDYVRQVFGDDGEKMVTIISECENGTWDQTRVNAHNRDGSVDYGIMQVNSKNDYLCRGLDYKNSWKENVECGYRIYKSQGLSAWACSHVIGVTPFYLKAK